MLNKENMEIILTPTGYGACIGCGAHDSHPNPELRFPNRQKVDDYYRCYNPNCEVAYYHPETGDWERKNTPEEEEAMNKRVKEWVDNLMRNREFVTETLPDGSERVTLEPRQEG